MANGHGGARPGSGRKPVPVETLVEEGRYEFNGRVCRRCGKWKSESGFHALPNSRLDSWCKGCRSAYSQEWRKRNPSAYAAHRELFADRPDALAYSRAVCEQVAALVERKIQKFESRHRLEAPPHLVAIVQLARSLAEQHPEGRAPSDDSPYREVRREQARIRRAHRSPEQLEREKQRQRRHDLKKKLRYQTDPAFRAKRLEWQRAYAKRRREEDQRGGS